MRTVLRLLLYIVLGYVIWRVIRALISMWEASAAKKQGRVHGTTGKRKQDLGEFHDIKDAEFEDLSKHEEQKKSTS